MATLPSGRFPRIPIDQAIVRQLYLRLAVGECVVFFRDGLSIAELRAAAERPVGLRVAVRPLRRP